MMTHILDAPAVEWYSQLTDDMILDITVGDFDEDSIDDIAAMSYMGRVYIYSSEKGSKLLDAVAGNDQLDNGINNFNPFGTLPVVQMVAAVPILIAGILVIARKRRFAS
ncbi:MAG: hypothetical protein ACTSP4_12240 [Candidatus Hodarchaeales archaeon]